MSVDVVDGMVAKENNTRMENSTRALNASKSILKIRAVDVQLKVVSSFFNETLLWSMNLTLLLYDRI